FYFRAEDSIREFHVTGVQTCALPIYPEFEERLNEWLNNIESEEDQKKLVRLIPNLFYIGREELNSLHKTAFESIVCRWLFDQKRSEERRVGREWRSQLQW